MAGNPILSSSFVLELSQLSLLSSEWTRIGALDYRGSHDAEFQDILVYSIIFYIELYFFGCISDMLIGVPYQGLMVKISPTRGINIGYCTISQTKSQF